MTTTMQPKEAIQTIQSRAEEICSNATQRFPEAASFGDSWRQGDIYITLFKKVPDFYVKSGKQEMQLAPGTTQGSRHCLDSLKGVTIYSKPGSSELEGPILDCQEERAVTHPEHGDVILPCGIYGITYQRDLDEEERERRVED